MIWKYELNVDDAQTAKDFKKEIKAIDSLILVDIKRKDRSTGQYTVRISTSSISNFDLQYKADIQRDIKKIYEKYANKIKTENRTSLRGMIRDIIMEAKK